MTFSDIIEKRNRTISEIKGKYLDKRNQLLIEMQWEIDAVEAEYQQEVRKRANVRKAA